MATLREVRRRIRSVENTQKITRAMQMVAAAKFNRAQGDVRNLRPFTEGVEELLEHYLRSGASARHPLLAREKVKKRALVVMTSDRGFCAAYNTNVLRRAVEELEAEEQGRISVIPYGGRSERFFRNQNWEVLHSYEEASDRFSPARAKEVAQNLGWLYSTGKVDRIDVVYTRFITTLNREVVVSPLLGIRLETEGPGAGVPYILEPSVDELLAELLPRVLASRVAAVLAESFASEHSARMVAMRLATDNASELIDDLTLIRNRMRQAAITKELADIVGAAEAMK